MARERCAPPVVHLPDYYFCISRKAARSAAFVAPSQLAIFEFQTFGFHQPSKHLRGIAPNALRIRAYRIRAALQKCLEQCVEDALR